MRKLFESIGGAIIILGCFALICMIALLFLKGGLWLSKTLYPFMYDLSVFAFIICFILFLPLSLSNKTKHISATGLMISSIIFGVFTWMCGFIIAYTLWGFIGLFIGLFIGGVGVVPIAILATLFNGEWTQMFHLILLLIVTFGFRFLSVYLAAKKD